VEVAVKWGVNSSIMNWPMLEAYAKNIWAVGGPLVGVMIGAYIGSRNQKKQWLRENRKAEYRELLSALADAGSSFLVHYSIFSTEATAEQKFRTGETSRKAVDVIYNRLFVAREIQELDILKRWDKAMSALQRSHDMDAFAKGIDAIMTDIRATALKEFS
jgi:hypothetical protein